MCPLSLSFLSQLHGKDYRVFDDPEHRDIHVRIEGRDEQEEEGEKEEDVDMAIAPVVVEEALARPIATTLPLPAPVKILRQSSAKYMRLPLVDRLFLRGLHRRPRASYPGPPSPSTRRRVRASLGCPLLLPASAAAAAEAAEAKSRARA